MLALLKRRPYPTALSVGGLVVALWLGMTRGCSHPPSDGQNATLRADMATIRAAAYRWHFLHGESTCPSVRQLVEGKFLDRDANKMDAWEQPFVITCMESGAVVTSFGPDRKRATPDDVVVATPNSDFAATR